MQSMKGHDMENTKEKYLIKWVNGAWKRILNPFYMEELPPNTIIEKELNGKKIAYHSTTQFLVQIGRGKSGYKTRYSIEGNLAQAIMYFDCINIGNGYKKRLIAPSLNKPLLLRQFS